MFISLFIYFLKFFKQFFCVFIMIYFSFNIMKPLKVVLFAQFLQILIRAQDLIILKHLNMEFASYFDFGEL